MPPNCSRVWKYLLPVVVATAGCASPYRSDRGALVGGLGGAGLGAVIGKASGNTAAGAAIGGVAGALTGGAIGAGLDEIEARNRAEIEARLGRPVAAGAVKFDEVVAMTQAGVDEEVIVTHIRNHGVAAPPQSHDLIYLQNHGVSRRVIQIMQSPPQTAPPVVVHDVPPPVIVEEYHYGPPPWGYRPHYHHRHYPPPPAHVGWGFSYHSH